VRTADSYAATVPAGQVGVWCGDGTANGFDDFKAREIAGPFEVDGKWQASRGKARVDDSDNNVLEIYGTDGQEDVLMRRGFRGDKYVATFKFKWNATTSPGWVVRWLSPGDYLAIAVSASDRKARLYKREADGTLSTLVTAGSALTLTSGTWYEAKVVVDNDPNDANLQQLRCWVDVNGNGYGDDSALITTTAVDDVWSAGLVGVYRAASSSGALQQYDDVKIGYDTDSDADITDAGDTIEVADDFTSSSMSLSYDNNGNLTNDGVLQYVYDGWNRLKLVQRKAAHSGQADDVTTLATYAYLPDNRRASKVVQHCGIEAVANDGGDTTVHFYYGGVPGASGGVARWNVFETRNGSNQSTRQWVWGSRYVDEAVFMDVNDRPTVENDCDPDTTVAAEISAPQFDRRFFYHQDRNWNVVALSEYADGVGTNARVVERYAYTPYGEFLVLKGDAGSGELGRSLATSTVGNPFFHQGLPLDQEKGSYQNRRRDYLPNLGRFGRRDPTGYRDGRSQYTYVGCNPMHRVDPTGLTVDDPSAVCRSTNPPSPDPSSGANGATICDGQGGVIACVDQCKCGNSLGPVCIFGYPPGSSPPNGPPYNPCPPPRPPGACNPCGSLRASCACNHEQRHIQDILDYGSNACVDDNGNPRLAGATPFGDNPTHYQTCLGLWSEVIAYNESATCFRNNGAGLPCQQHDVEVATSNATAAQNALDSECGPFWHP
jgi:RHS repeat-associated protein